VGEGLPPRGERRKSNRVSRELIQKGPVEDYAEARVVNSYVNIPVKEWFLSASMAA